MSTGQVSRVTDLLDERFLWASLTWGSLGTGYLVLGWHRKEPVPAIGGLVVVGLSCGAEAGRPCPWRPWPRWRWCGSSWDAEVTGTPPDG